MLGQGRPAVLEDGQVGVFSFSTVLDSVPRFCEVDVHDSSGGDGSNLLGDGGHIADWLTLGRASVAPGFTPFFQGAWSHGCSLLRTRMFFY
jgi:hypothetical protein